MLGDGTCRSRVASVIVILVAIASCEPRVDPRETFTGCVNSNERSELAFP